VILTTLRAALGRWPFSAGYPQRSARAAGQAEADNSARRNTQEAWESGRDLLQAIVDHSTAVIYVKDLDGRFLLVNRRFEELFHVSRASVVGKTDYDVFPAERADAFRAFDKRVLEAGIPLEAEEVAPHDDGLHTYISVKCPLRDASGTPYGVCSISTDITERKQAEQALRISKEKYQSLYDDTPVMMHSIDREGRLLSVSNYWLDALGYERDEVIGRSSVDFLTPESRRYAQDVVLPEYFRTGRCRDVPYQFVKKNGEFIDVLLSATAERDEHGAIARSLAVLIDVTERKRAEEMLHRMASIVQSTSDAANSATRDRVVTSWNRGAERLYGYTAAEMIGRPATSTIPPHRADEAEAMVERVLAGETIGEIETERLRKDGAIIPIELTVSPVTDSSGAIIGIASIARDITRRKQMEAALRESEQRFRDYAETASDWFWETGPDHTFTYVSQPHGPFAIDTSARLGVRRIDIAADREEEPEKWQRHLSALERHEPFRDFIYKTRRKDDFVAVVSTSGKPRFDANGRFIGYRGTARDITYAVRAAEALRASEERFRDFAETESDWFWETGSDHRVTWMSERVGSAGFVETSRVGKRRWDYAMDVEQEPEKWRQHQATLERHEPFRDFVFKVKDEHGAECFVSTSGKAVLGADGKFLGYRGVGRDVTDTVRDAQALRDSEERLELAVEAGRMGTWDFDIRRNVVQWSPRFAHMLGMSETETVASYETSLEHIHENDRDSVVKNLAAALAGGAGYRDEFRVHSPAEGERWLDSRGIIVRDDAGQPIRMVGLVQDITERKEAERRQKLLLDELNHRVKNTLVTVQSMAMQMARGVESPDRFYKAFQARLLALSHAHDLLTRGAWQGAPLRQLLEQALAPYADGDERRIALSGPDIRLNPNVAVGLAMAFEELATNATKFGALSVPDGRIAVTWTTEEGDAETIEIRWRESGGPAVAEPRRRGFGSRLLERGLAYELKAEVRLDFAPAGLECRIRLPARRP
jgi:PAS domain S-box-containing protein